MRSDRWIGGELYAALSRKMECPDNSKLNASSARSHDEVQQIERRNILGLGDFALSDSRLDSVRVRTL